MRVTALVLSVDEAALLEQSLPAARAQQPPAELVVIDNACTDATATVAAAHGARVLRLASRLSYAAAMNAGLSECDGDAVLLLNADCFLRPGFIEASLARLAETGVGAVAPKLIRAADGRIDAAAMFVDRRGKNGLVGHGRPATDFQRAGPAFGADGAAALYRREALQDCRLPGGELLDEDMALWASDADLAWRAQLLGWRCVYEPAAVADHVRTYAPSTRARVSPEHRRLQFRNRYLMLLKNARAADLRRDLPAIALYELLALGHVLLRERELLGGYADAWRLRHRALDRRRAVQARARSRPPFGLRPVA